MRHVGRQRAAIVLADGLLERRNVARLHLDEHGAMFGLREPRPVDEDIAEVEAAHAIPVVDGPLRHVVEERHVGEPADREVEAGVDVGPVQRRSRLEGAVHLGDEPGQVLEVGRGGALGGDARGDDLQPFEQGEDLDDRGARDRRDGGADVRDARTSPSDWSRRSASRTGMMLTLNCRARSSMTRRVPGLSSHRMIDSRSVV